MANNESHPPDLASVLRTLASLAPSAQQKIGQQPNIQRLEFSPQVPPFDAASNPEVWPERSTTPPCPPPTVTSVQSHHEQQPNPQPWIQGSQHGIQLARPFQPTKNVIDPSTIIEWSAGLKCAMKAVAKNETIVQEIRRMIKIQHEHEEQWWNGRKALVQKLAARKEGKKRLDEILRSVSGSVAEGHSDDSPESHARELETFDMKVYKAQMQMVREMNSRLRNLGIPFFGTRTELVRPFGKESLATGSVDASKDGKGVIDEIELVKLQRRMLQMLEDLSSEE